MKKKIICNNGINECTGCGLCSNICNKNAIKMVANKKGFVYPEVEEKKCVNCNLCQRICPQNNKIDLQEVHNVFAIKNKSDKVRKDSSSGGVFDPIARYFILNNGVVYGAAYDNNFNVNHIRIDKLEDINLLRKSKYVQSRIDEIYTLIKNDLKNGKKVLFSGTPCQVHAIKKYVSNNPNLFTCDIVCHGCPSPKVFSDYISFQEKRFKSKIKLINFRFKTLEHTQNMKIDFENGKEYIKFKYEDIYYKLFLSNIILRESCYNCKYTSYNRCSDITLADFWNFNDNNKFDDKKGISMIFVNSDWGKKIIELIKENIDKIEAPISECYQPQLEHPVERKKDVDDFWEKYNANFEDIKKRYLNHTLRFKVKRFIKTNYCKFMKINWKDEEK